MKNKKKVLLIGWDAADWKFLNPLIDKGLMPSLKKLIEGGVMGRLATLDPPLSPTLWTSIATGKRPYKHGIHGFTEPIPNGKGLRPIYITNRKVKAIWNILNQFGLKTHVVGWWPSHPAEPINGVMISNLYQRANAAWGAPWPMKRGTVHPSEKSDFFAQLRIHPGELTAAHIQPFVPQLEKVDQSRDGRLFGISKMLADCSSIHTAATYIMEHEDWDFMAIYYDAIDHFCHGFMKYYPPRRPHISVQEYEFYKEVVNSACRYHDMMLERLIELAGEDTTIILISDHGFHPDHNRPLAIPDEPAGPAIEHSPYGIIVMNGAGIKEDTAIYGASLLDICPTLLNLYGLPIGEDMDGKVLIDAFESRPEIPSIKSWENIAPAAGCTDGRHPKNMEMDEEEAQAELQQLIELGYVEDFGEDEQTAVKNTLNENNFNLARAYINGNEWEEGIKILEKLHLENPNTMRFAVRLAYAYQNTGNFKSARTVVNHIRNIQNRESVSLDVLEGTLLLAEERFQKALQLFQKAEREGGNLQNIHLRIAHTYLQINRLEAAEKSLMREMELNPEEASVYFTLGITYFRQMRYEEALTAFMDAIGLMYYYPAAHFYIGETYSAMQDFEKAIKVFETCLKIAPNFNMARQRILQILKVNLQEPERMPKYQLDFQQSLDGTIYIVSGLPRSGTSMMMQMLKAGGMEIFTDQERQADENNPKGYYEHQAVKGLAKRQAFLKHAKGKVVKIIANLLPFLPMKYQYRIVFMQRDLYEVVASQQSMLSRNGKKTKRDTLPIHLVKQYEQTLQQVKKWAKEMPHVEMIEISYSEVIVNPFMQAIMVDDFLDNQLQLEAMAQMVDAGLYRSKQQPA